MFSAKQKSRPTPSNLLCFPHARLFIHNILAKHNVTGSDAIIQGASEFGLLAGPVVERLRFECGEKCCFEAGRRVLFHHLQERAFTQLFLCNFDEIWSNIENRAREYESNYVLGPCGSPEASHKCERLAPVLFDLILQELHRY